MTSGNFLGQPLPFLAKSGVESRRDIRPCPSQLDPDVRLSPHPAPDKLDFSSLAHVDILVTALMYCYQVSGFPIIVISVYVMKMNTLILSKL